MIHVHPDFFWTLYLLQLLGKSSSSISLLMQFAGMECSKAYALTFTKQGFATTDSE